MPPTRWTRRARPTTRLPPAESSARSSLLLSQVRPAGLHDHGLPLHEVPHGDGALPDLDQRPVAAVDCLPVGASHGCRRVTALGPEAALALGPEDAHGLGGRLLAARGR